MDDKGDPKDEENLPGADSHHEGSSQSDSEEEIGADCRDADGESGPDVNDDSESGSESEEEVGFSSDTSNGESEKCPICLQRFSGQEIGVPDNCEHHFCLHCIAQWAKKVTTCPIDRKCFNSIMVKNELDGEIKYIEDVTIRDASSVDWDEQDLDPTFCEVCGHSDREDRLLLCDRCDAGYHLECLEPPLTVVPIEDWYCPQCAFMRNTNAEPQPSTSRANITRQSQPRVPRTSLSRMIMQQRLTLNSSCITKPTSTLSQPNTPRATRNKTTTKSYRKSRRKYKTKSAKGGLKKGRRKRKKRRVKRTLNAGSRNPNRCRVAQQMKPTTAKGRLAQNLGLILPRPGQPLIGLPSYRPTKDVVISTANPSRAPTRRKRYQDGIVPALSLFGSQYDLSECLETVSDEEGSVGVARVQPIQRIGFPRKISYEARREIEPLHLSSSSNVLGPILNSQRMLLIRDFGRNTPARVSSPPDDSKFYGIPPLCMSKDADNDSSGYDSARGNGDFPAGIPQSNENQSVPFLTATGGSTSSSVQPSSSDTVESQNTSTSPASHSNSSSIISSPAGGFANMGGSDSTNNRTQGIRESIGGQDYVQFGAPSGNIPRKDSQNKEAEKVEPKDADDDDDYNIYSDIEDPREDLAASPRQDLFSILPSLPAVEDLEVEKVKDPDSDSDMVIDEEQVAGTVGSRERDSRSSVESLSQVGQVSIGEKPAVDVENLPSAPVSSDLILPEPNLNNLVDNLDAESPESIPLPDNSPPPPVRLDPDDDVIYLPTFGLVKKDEYDPSQPLTSSDEEDEEVKPTKVTERNTTSTSDTNLRSPSKLTSAATKDNNEERNNPNSTDDDNDELSSIPLPDEYRRPAIQFQIPSRHRLFPISSLIKRQKGVMRKETTSGSTQSFQGEISRAFAADRGDDEEEGETHSETGNGNIDGDSASGETEKVSLVAEIFGSDNDEDEEKPVPLTPMSHPAPPVLNDTTSTPVSIPTPVPPTAESSADRDNKWKKIVDDEVSPITGSKSTQVENPPTVVDICKDDEVTIINKEENDVVKLNGDKKVKENRSRLQAGRAAGSFFESISDEEGVIFDGSSTKNSLDSRKVKAVTVNVSATPAPETKEGSTTIKRSRKDKETEKDPEKEKKIQKRKRSVSSTLRSNFEEGEIAESPEKKKRKPRKPKKSKYRRARSDSVSSKDFSDKQGEELGPHSTSSDDGGGGIPWKKPSKSTKERNYRDGKPKTEEKFFREKDKKGDSSAHGDRRKKTTENRDTSSSRGPGKDKNKERDKVSDSKRGHKRSVSRSRSKTPLPWRSISRSVSKSKTRERKRSNSSSSNKSMDSRSPSVHLHSRSSPRRRWKRRRRHSGSQRRGFRSRSRSRSLPRARSRSPNRRTHTRRRSRSASSREKKLKVRRHSISSSSGSDDKSPSPRNKTKKRSNTDEKIQKKSRKDKEKEKGSKEKGITQEQAQAKDKEKDKKKKKRRREKSASPAKEIFTDGDSIVVSLNFQKGKEAGNSTGNTSTKDPASTGAKNDESTDQRKRRTKHSRKSSAERDGVVKPLKKTILIDLESSPIQEQNIGVSPTLIVLSDDEEALLDPSKSTPTKNSRGKESGGDREGLAVSTSSVGALKDGSTVSPNYRHGGHGGHGVPADSTQLQPHQSELQSHPANTSSADDGSSSSPTRGDSLVTSTRDSVEIPLPQDEETRSPPSPQPPQPRVNSPLTPPLPPGTPPKESTAPVDNSSHKDVRLISTSSPLPMSLGQNFPQNFPPPPVVNLGMGGRPVMIGNIPGLFPSASMGAATSNIPGISALPTPIIPTPPPPQIRYNQAVLASVANALYLPTIAKQFQQQTMARFPPLQLGNTTGIGTAPRVGDRQNQGQGTVLLQKNQNSHSSNNRRSGGEGGESPFSPNSSEGDDLFEPPKEKTSSPGDNRQSAGYGSMNLDKSDHGGTNSSGGQGGSGKGKNAKLFDTLFGGPVVKKSNQVQPGMHPKLPHSDKSFKCKPLSHHKVKSPKKAQKKEIVKLSEGELRMSEDVPTSAVELQHKEKFLKKQIRQERVVEEVKLSLKPHYSKKHVNKDEYKEILRRAVPKICHNKSGEINPSKIKELVEAYVKQFRKNKKKW